MRHTVYVIAGCFLIMLLLACQPQTDTTQASASPAASEATATLTATLASSPSPADNAVDPFSVSSTGIVNGVLNDIYGARGAQKANGIPSRSFPLSFAQIPDGTACLALTVIDPDGGNWTHWLAANIPPADLAENASIDLASKMVQGTNDFGFVGYGGPTPPSGTHTYVITVYALSEALPLQDGFSRKQFEEKLTGKSLASATLTGDYAH